MSDDLQPEDLVDKATAWDMLTKKNDQIADLRTQLAEANARAERLIDHVDKMVMLFGTSGDALTDFEEVSSAFHRATGKLRPGKDAPVPEMAATQDEFRAWVNGLCVEAQKAAHDARQALSLDPQEPERPTTYTPEKSDD